MAFKLEVIRGATTYTISDGAPFSIEGAEGLGGATVRDIEESGPYQDGVTHLDERLDPRVVTLRLNIHATSASALDGYRDTLMTIFKPARGVPIILKLTRDDGTVRQLDTRRTGPLDIPLVKENRPGNLHRAVVQLRAADPAWYDPAQQEASFTPPQGAWWLAQATIPGANVLEYVENPTQGQLWANAGSVAAGSAWTIAWRSGSVTPPTGYYRAFLAKTSSFNTVGFSADNSEATGYRASFASLISVVGESDMMGAGTQNYFMISRGTAGEYYRGTVLVGVDNTGGNTNGLPGTASGTAYWRNTEPSDGAGHEWPVALPQAAVYNIALDATQRANLNTTMTGNAGESGTAYTVAIPYAGDIDSYPIITVQGPINDPVIINTTTGDVLDFTGGTVGTADTWVIDLRYGRKSALFGTTSIEQYLSGNSALATFRLVPDPIATGGTNTISVNSSDAGTAASVSIAYYNRYQSY